MINKYIGDYVASEVMVDMGDRFAFQPVADVLANEKYEEKRSAVEEMAEVIIRISEDKIYFMKPLPNGLTADHPEVQEAVKAGVIAIADNMIVEEGKKYELRDDGIYTEIPGCKDRISRLNTDNEGELLYFLTKYRKK